MSTVHTILGDLYRLLGTYNSDDFANAAKYPGLGDPLKNALRSLASESRRMSAQLGKRSEKRPVERPSNTLRGLPRVQDKELLVDAILRSQFGSTVSSIARFAADRGLKFEVRPKEGRNRAARRLANTLETAPDGKRLQIMESLIGDTSSQTQGWFNVIKGSKR